MDAAVATEFEQNCIGRARLMLSCHFPKIDVRLSRNSMRRVRQMLDEFFMWQANQSSDDLSPATDTKPLDSGSPALRIAVLLDISSALINVSERDDGPDVVPDAEQLALLFGDSRVFMSNAGISRGRTFVCFEAGRAELQRNDLADPELRTIFSSMAKMDPIANFTSPSIPQVGFYFLSAPSLKDISDAVVQLSWTSFSLKALLRCAKDFGKLLEFAVDEQPDLPPPPPRPMRVCLNARDSSIKYSPPEDGLPDTAIAVGTFIQMLHINMPEPEESNRSKRRDQEPNRYVFEDISVMAESPNALTSAPDHLDQWNSVRRFWENRKFVPLLYSDTFDITIRIEGSNEDQEDQNGGGGNSPFINLVFSCEKVVLEICADSRQSLMGIARSIGKSISPSPTTLPMASDARRSPQVVHTGTDNILADIEEGVFGAANVGSSPQHRKQNLSPSTHSGSRRNSHASRLSSCSSGARGGGLTFVEDYISASIPDISSEYEVVANPTSPKLTSPSYKSLDPKRHTPHHGGLGSSPVQRRGDVVEEVPAEHRSNALDMIGPELGAPSLYSPNLEAHPFTSPKEATTSYYSPDNIVKVKPYGGDGGGSSSRGLDIIDDHFAAPDPQELRWGEQSRGQDRISRIAVIIENLLVHLYDGSDWERPDPRYGSGSSTITKSGVPMDRRGRSHLCDGWGAEDSEAMDRHVFSKSYPEDSSPMAEFFEYDEDCENDDDEDSVIVPRTIGGGGGGRSATPQIIVQSRRVYAMLEMFSENSPIAFGTTIDLDTFEIIDNLESSEWHKFLTRLKGEDIEYGASSVQSSSSRGAKNADVPIFERATSYSPGKSGHVWPESRDESFIQLKVESIRPHPSLATTEVRMDIEIAPVRCYIDQDALEFLIGFFSAPQLARGSDMSGRQPPMDAASESMQLEPYFQAVHVAPLRVRFDYKPKRVDFGQVRGGNMVELLNLFPLEDADMSLSSAYIYGVKGVQRLAQRLKDHWLPHVTRTQMPRLVSGLAPLRAVSNLGSSASDLIFLPLQQYKKDGRIVKGIQRGAKSFAKSAALGMLDLGARVAVNAQTLLEQAGDILNVDIGSGNNNNNDATTIPVTGRITGYQHDSDEDFVDIEDEGWPNDVTIDLVDFPDTLSVRSSIPSVGNGRRADARKMPSSHNIGTNFLKSKYARQPLSANQGIRQAYQSLTRQFSEASQTILAIPIEIKQSSNRSGAVRSTTHSSVRAVVRAVPVAILKPAIGATEATSKALLGIRNSLDSRHRRQLEDKYKPRSAAGRDYR
ncbi:autophagy- protein 2 [Spiromyces aspiralis]|uniref:Autophagy- protein 2 n=1 Tax=Spiromyces aspiralis TaxID=68401 RepID=A0ACC1HWI6_9FUNG|nr:autophagy- protein 2 [Spiromyces aspiralis]